MHERDGAWHAVYVRFRRWAEQGVWEAMLQTPVDPGLTDDWRHRIDSTSIRGHAQAAGAQGGRARTALVEAAAALRARGVPAARVRAALRGVILTPGEASDDKAAEALMDMDCAKPCALLADTGYDGDALRQSLRDRPIEAIIPPRSNRRTPVHPDYRRYRDRTRIERLCGFLKHKRRIATMCDKAAVSVMAFLNRSPARLWIKSFVNRP